MDEFEKAKKTGEPVDEAVQRLSKLFKVSTLVILRRFLDAKEITPRVFKELYDEEILRLEKLSEEAKKDKESGGDFFKTELVRVGQRFAVAVLQAAKEGTTLYRDAMHLLGLKNESALDKLSEMVGVS